MRRAVEMRGGGEGEADQSHEGRDGMHDEDDGERLARVGGELEIAGIVVREESIWRARWSAQAAPLCPPPLLDSPVLYPILYPEHLLPLQYPNTPKFHPW